MNTTHTVMHLGTDREGIRSRRSFLRTLGMGAVGAGVLGWKDALALRAAELRKENRACILLYMRGGPSQFETFDPKPNTEHGGSTRAIQTAVKGVQIAEPWTRTAAALQDFAIIRSVTNKEGEHQRASYQLHTGYVPNGSVKYPSMGSIVASEIAPRDFDLPHFVSVSNPGTTIGAGFLGMAVAPFIVPNPTQMPTNVELPGGVNDKRFKNRLDLLKDLEEDFAAGGGKTQVDAHQTLYAGAAQMVLSPRLKAFDLSQEKDSVRDRYGRNSFGQGCLLARRLIEEGITFVEVEQNGWDTHDDNFNRTKSLAEATDPAFATLLEELKERGRLERTLVIWMGEFGRTPKINARTGRDHYPRVFNVALAGAGIKGGQVIGSSNPGGAEVKDRPVAVDDLFCSFYKALGINPRKENIAARPVRLVEHGEAVKELF
jgi:hypothetical protein